MGTADTLLEKIYSWLELQSEGAERLKQLASDIEDYKKYDSITQVVGSSVSVGGAATIAAAGLLTFFTGGAGFLALAATGATASSLGFATSVVSTAVETFMSFTSMKEAQQIGEKIEKVAEEIQELMETLTDEWEETPGQIASPEDYVMEKLVRAMVVKDGLKISDKIILTNVLPAFTLGNIAVQLQKKSGMSAGMISQFVVNMVSKVLLKKAAKKGAKRAARQAAKRAGQAAAKAAASKGLSKAAASAGSRVASKAVRHIGGGGILLLFSLPELVNNSVSLAEKKYVTEDITMMRENAAAIRESSEQMKKDLDDIREQLQQFSRS